MTTSRNFQTVDEYIGSFPLPVRQKLEQVRAAIKETAPEAIEMISYRMPAFKLNGKPLVYFGGYKDHIGFYPTPGGIGAFQKELSQYKSGKGSAQFPLKQPMPLDLVTKMVKYRVRELLKGK